MSILITVKKFQSLCPITHEIFLKVLEYYIYVIINLIILIVC